MAAPSMTFGAVANALASQSLAAGASVNCDIDFSAVFLGQVTVKNTPGGSVSSTRGLKVEPLVGFGASGTAEYSTLPVGSFQLPSQTASTLESLPIVLGPGKYRVKLTNLDATNAVTVSVTSASVSGIA